MKHIVFIASLLGLLLIYQTDDAFAQNTSQSSITRMQHTVDTIKKGMDQSARNKQQKTEGNDCIKEGETKAKTDVKPCKSDAPAAVK